MIIIEICQKHFHSDNYIYILYQYVFIVPAHMSTQLTDILGSKQIQN